jgi:hypothetical protein
LNEIRRLRAIGTQPTHLLTPTTLPGAVFPDRQLLAADRLAPHHDTPDIGKFSDTLPITDSCGFTVFAAVAVSVTVVAFVTGSRFIFVAVSRDRRDRD